MNSQTNLTVAAAKNESRPYGIIQAIFDMDKKLKELKQAQKSKEHKTYNYQGAMI